MPEQKLYSTKIQITGAVDAKLFSDIKKLIGNSGIAKLIDQSKQLKKESKEAFNVMAESTEIAKRGLESFAEVLKDIAPQLLTIGSATAVVAGLFDMIKEGVNKFKELREETGMLKGVLAARNDVGKGADLKHMLENYLAVSEEVAKEQGNIFASSFYLSAETKLAEAGLGTEKVKALLVPLTNLAALNKGTWNLKPEDIAGYAEQIKTAFNSGDLGRLRKVFGLTKADAKAFAEAAREGNKALETRIILSGKNVRTAMKEFEAMDAGQKKMKQAVALNEEAAEKMGKPWTDVAGMISMSGLLMNTELMPTLTDLGTLAGKFAHNIGGPVFTEFNTELKNTLRGIDHWINRATTTDWSKVYDELGLKKMGDGWWHAGDVINEHVINPVRDYILGIVNHIDTLNHVDAGWKGIGEAIINAGKGLDNWLWDAVKGSTQWMADTWKAIAGYIGQATHGNFGYAVSPTGVPQPSDNNFGHSFERHALGGITTGAHFGLVGENGPELIAPLKNPDVLDQSLTFLRKADETNEKQLEQLTTIAKSINPFASGGGFSGAGGGGYGGGGGGASAGAFAGAYRAESYGPIEGEFGSGATVGPLGKLLPTDIAVSLNMLSKFPLGSFVDVINQAGNIIDSNLRVADYSYRAPGVPNTNTFELRNMHDIGYAGLQPHHLAHGGIVNRRVLAWLGDNSSHKEAVVPLDRNGTAKGFGSSVMQPSFHITVNATGNGDDIARAIDERMRDEFANYLNMASFEHQRRSLN